MNHCWQLFLIIPFFYNFFHLDQFSIIFSIFCNFLWFFPFFNNFFRFFSILQWSFSVRFLLGLLLELYFSFGKLISTFQGSGKLYCSAWSSGADLTGRRLAYASALCGSGSALQLVTQHRRDCRGPWRHAVPEWCIKFYGELQVDPVCGWGVEKSSRGWIVCCSTRFSFGFGSFKFDGVDDSISWRHRGSFWGIFSVRYWVTYFTIDWLNDWLLVWLSEWVVDWLFDWLLAWLRDWLIVFLQKSHEFGSGHERVGQTDFRALDGARPRFGKPFSGTSKNDHEWVDHALQPSRRNGFLRRTRSSMAVSAAAGGRHEHQHGRAACGCISGGSTSSAPHELFLQPLFPLWGQKFDLLRGKWPKPTGIALREDWWSLGAFVCQNPSVQTRYPMSNFVYKKQEKKNHEILVKNKTSNHSN